MRKRCLNKNSTRYKYYGKLGITICKEWSSFEVFELWSLSNGYSDKLSIDRINTKGNYEPSNCRWTTLLIQKQNRGKFKNNTSGFKGVNWNKKESKWMARIQVNNKRFLLGLFSTAEEGAIIYNKYITDNNLNHPLNDI